MPDWDQLFRVASGQAGYFTTRQAAAAGYSPQLLLKYLRNRRVVRALRSVYKIRHFPAGGWDHLVPFWLWSERAAVFSHETALALHGLGARPRRVHLTLPSSWRRRRLRLPAGVVVHHADIPANERTRVGPVPATSVRRTRREVAPRPKFLCLICADRLMEQMSPREAARHLAQYRVVTDRLRRRGQLLGAHRLLPTETATTVRVRGRRVSVIDGPFSETKEMIGGYFLIQARDRDEAVRVAATIPGAHIGCVEVRPIADDAGTLHALGMDVDP
jgi:hypothetical protein